MIEGKKGNNNKAMQCDAMLECSKPKPLWTYDVQPRIFPFLTTRKRCNQSNDKTTLSTHLWCVLFVLHFANVSSLEAKKMTKIKHKKKVTMTTIYCVANTRLFGSTCEKCMCINKGRRKGERSKCPGIFLLSIGSCLSLHLVDRT